MMVEVTQEDRDTLDAATAEWRMGDSSVSLEIIAAYRQASYQRGRLEGARLALEAVFPEVVTDRTIDSHGAHCRCTTCELNIAEDAIRALDPAKIVGEG